MNLEELRQHLITTYNRDFDGSWSWEKNDAGAPVVLPEFSAPSGKLSTALAASISDIKTHDGKPPKLLPILPWYPKGSWDPFFRTGSIGIGEDNARFQEALSISQLTGLEIKEGIYKLNYTGASQKSTAVGKPSFYAGGIEPGESYIIVDDTVASGGTIRDLMRYINDQEGFVVGVIETSRGTEGKDELHVRPRNRDREELIRHLWLIENVQSLQTDLQRKLREGAILIPDNLPSWRQREEEKKHLLRLGRDSYWALPENEEVAFKQMVTDTADRYLLPLGYRFNQLTTGELYDLARAIEKAWPIGFMPSNGYEEPIKAFHNMEDFWDRQIDHIANGYSMTPLPILPELDRLLESLDNNTTKIQRA